MCRKSGEWKLLWLLQASLSIWWKPQCYWFFSYLKVCTCRRPCSDKQSCHGGAYGERQSSSFEDPRLKSLNTWKLWDLQHYSPSILICILTVSSLQPSLSQAASINPKKYFIEAGTCPSIFMFQEEWHGIEFQNLLMETERAAIVSSFPLNTSGSSFSRNTALMLPEYLMF